MGAACAAESVLSSLGDELWEEGGVLTFLGGTGMSQSSMSMGKYDTLQAINEVRVAASLKVNMHRDGLPPGAHKSTPLHNSGFQCR